MGLVKNPTHQDLYCDVACLVVPAHGTVQVSDEVAAQVPTHVFVVTIDSPPPVVAEEPVAPEVLPPRAAAPFKSAAAKAAQPPQE